MSDRIPFQMDIGDRTYTMLAADTDNPVALDYIVRAVNVYAALLAALEAVEWIGFDNEKKWRKLCPCCKNWEDDGHAPDCQLDKVLRDAKGGE